MLSLTQKCKKITSLTPISMLVDFFFFGLGPSITMGIFASQWKVYLKG